jgi:UDP-N-acetylglucosamine--N-acetylmuramyl-(pentapeptide) pyrophosphoryl-undecaprenol N-acetylglucosamine transferase
MKKIILTGGGSAGHVTPNLALISKLKAQDWDIQYIGSKNGIEKELIEKTDIPYHPISSGKLRRYFDLKNFRDPFKVAAGIGQAAKIIRKEKPDVVFSKGGFVSVPVVVGAWLNNVPVYIHESDYTPGLANKLALRFATKIFVTFDETLSFLPKHMAVHSGSPIREDILSGDRDKGLKFLNFSYQKPIITIMGGSLGSKKLNEIIRKSLPNLLQRYQIVHLCGKGNIDENVNQEGYRQFEYINEELPHILAATNLVVSRAGSNAIFEFLSLRKPMLLIPLSKQASRGDQIINANSFQSKGFADVLEEEELTTTTLVNAVNELYANRVNYIDKMHEYAPKNAINEIVKFLSNK